jgi:hypothetical protein
MMRRARMALTFVSVASFACGGSSGSKDAPGSPADSGARDASGRDGAQADSAHSTTRKDSGAAPDARTLPIGTPISWAEAWVKGFYGSTKYQGINVYSNTDTSGFPNGYHIQWHSDPGAPLYNNVSDCSSFSDMLLQRSYGWIPATTNPRPKAEDYYWAIRNAQGFAEIGDIHDIQVGDVLTLLYPPGETDTGHVAWIDSMPQAFSGAPAEEGLSAYVVWVIDSTSGFHDGPTGPTTAADDRYLGTSGCTSDNQCITLYGPNALCNTTQLIDDAVCSLTGVGRGQMRLYVDASGTIQGHTWSPDALSTFYSRPSPLPTKGGSFTGEDVVVGRYNRR